MQYIAHFRRFRRLASANGHTDTGGARPARMVGTEVSGPGRPTDLGSAPSGAVYGPLRGRPHAGVNPAVLALTTPDEAELNAA